MYLLQRSSHYILEVIGVWIWYPDSGSGLHLPCQRSALSECCCCCCGNIICWLV